MRVNDYLSCVSCGVRFSRNFKLGNNRLTFTEPRALYFVHSLCGRFITKVSTHEIFIFVKQLPVLSRSAANQGNQQVATGGERGEGILSSTWSGIKTAVLQTAVSVE